MSELLVSAPALDATALPNTETVTYKLQHDSDSAFGSATDTADILTQTGAGGTGADAAEARFAIPTDGERYWRVVATTSSSTGDCSAEEVEVALVF